MQCYILKNTLLHTAFSAILPAGRRFHSSYWKFNFIITQPLYSVYHCNIYSLVSSRRWILELFTSIWVDISVMNCQIRSVSFGHRYVLFNTVTHHKMFVKIRWSFFQPYFAICSFVVDNCSTCHELAMTQTKTQRIDVDYLMISIESLSFYTSSDAG